MSEKVCINKEFAVHKFDVEDDNGNKVPAATARTAIININGSDDDVENLPDD
jgi:hypothetical protein